MINGPVDEEALWRELGLALTQRGHAWRLAALATVADDGGADARTVVLRDVDAAARRLVFFTEAGSTKVRQLAQQPRGTLLFWSASLSWQLRVTVRLSVLTDGAAIAARWSKIAGTAAERDYLAADGSVQFAVVTAQALCLDWLALSADGMHRSARFDSGDASHA